MAIVEDEEKTVKVLQGYLSDYGKGVEKQINCSVFLDPIDFVDNYSPRYELILLDIQMPNINGMKVAEKVRLLDSHVLIVFVTNMVQYAVEGYKVEAVDFILKPVSNYAFAKMMDKIVKIIHQRKENGVMICMNRKTLRLPAAQIKYIESHGHKVFCYTEMESFETWDNMSTLEKQLPEGRFSRINSGTLVNLNYVMGIEKEMVVLHSHEVLPISRRRKKDFLAELARFHGEKHYV